MKSSKKALDDLTKISGIGESRQNWFRESFGILTFQDLANLTVAQIEEKMQTDGLIISRKAIETWLVQASELASHVDEASQIAKELPDDLLTGVSSSMPREDGWKPVASFVVEYQTRKIGERPIEQRTVAHHMEEDRNRTWPIIEGKQLCQWIIDQIPPELSRNREKQELLYTQPLGESFDIKTTAVKITQLRILQPANTTSPVQTIDPGIAAQASVLHEQPFTFEVDFELVGPTAEEVARSKVGWSAETRTFDPVSSTSPQLCESGPKSFEKGRLKYGLGLPEINLQQGNYRMWLLVTPERPSIALPDFLDIPNLQVV